MPTPGEVVKARQEIERIIKQKNGDGSSTFLFRYDEGSWLFVVSNKTLGLSGGVINKFCHPDFSVLKQRILDKIGF